MMRLARHPAIMAGFALPLPLRALGWAATIVMAAAVVATVAAWLG